VRGRKGGEVEAHSTASHAGTKGKWGRRGPARRVAKRGRGDPTSNARGPRQPML
jgi:hypothetical protein